MAFSSIEFIVYNISGSPCQRRRRETSKDKSFVMPTSQSHERSRGRIHRTLLKIIRTRAALGGVSAGERKLDEHVVIKKDHEYGG
jgi:hypothetical protein